MKTEIEMAKEGEFLREYGKQYFVVASEALSIGRVKWNMVPINKGGQDDIAFYLTTEQMVALCSEILSGRFHVKIKDDNGSFPTAYAYMTGEDGSLHLAIGGGKAGCRIQMRNTKATPKALSYVMGVSLDAMVTMARKYMLCTGLTNVVPGTYYASVIAAFEEGRKDRSKFRKPSAAELGEVVNTNSVVDESAPAESAPAAPAPVAAAPAADIKAETSETPAENCTITVKGAKTTKKGFYAFDGTDEFGKAVTLLFRKADSEKLSWFTKFEDAAAAGETKLTISGEKRDNCILYKGPAKKN